MARSPTPGRSTAWAAARSGDDEARAPQAVYPLDSFSELLAHCGRTGQSLWEYVAQCEGDDIWKFLDEIWQAMRKAMARGLAAEGLLPGGLGVSRKAWIFYRKTLLSASHFSQFELLSAYALAVSEENASGGIVVTAPTCGSCGVLPAVLRYVQEHVNCADVSILHALATAGLIGNLVKHNASISGAGGRLPGRDRHGLRHGGRRGRTALRRHRAPDRVRRGDGLGAPSGADLRSGRWPRPNPLHRAQRVLQPPARSRPPTTRCSLTARTVFHSMMWWR